jgi:hypothetical protein
VLLSAALIVRDEAAELGGCLASIESLVDEMVGVDTGSVVLRCIRQLALRREYRDSVLCLLFVGTLRYYPNEDAVAGHGASTRLRDVPRNARVQQVGMVADLAPSYHAADAVIVPTRAGGAFAHGSPVVASTLGAEGIDALPEQHLVIADTPEALQRTVAGLLELRARR